jgi:hypothetical protein
VWKVKELFMFDPTEDYLKPSLVGYRQDQGVLKLTEPIDDRITSHELGITLERDGSHLLLRDAKTGKELPLPETPAERNAKQQAVEMRAKNDQLQEDAIAKNSAAEDFQGGQRPGRDRALHRRPSAWVRRVPPVRCGWPGLVVRGEGAGRYRGGPLDAASQYPRPGSVGCTVLSRVGSAVRIGIDPLGDYFECVVPAAVVEV